MSALDNLRELDQQIARVRNEARSEIVKRVAQTKDSIAELQNQLKELEAEYIKITGRNLKGKKVRAPKPVEVSSSEKESLV